MNIRRWRQFDFSLGVQEATTWLMKKPNELARGINLKFTETVGGFQRRDGFVVSGDPFSTQPNAPTGGHIAKFTTGAIPFAAVNNNAGTATVVRTQNPTTGAWTTLPTISYPPNSIIFFADHLDEVYISGFDPATGDPVQPYNVDKTLDVSSTRNILNMPACYFIQEFLGLLYAANVKIGSQRYADRVYKSSPPLGAVTFIQGAQTDPLAPVTLYDMTPTMTNYSAPSGVVLASSEVNAGNQAWQAFNDQVNPLSRWIAATSANEWVRYDFGSGNAKVATYYSLVGEAPGESVNRGPKTWIFQGSNDGSTWTDLDTRTNQPTWNQAASEKRVFSIANTTAYRYYRLFVSTNQGADYIAVQELEILTSTEGTKSLQLLLDSVRYLKPGMAIDMYKAGTETKLYDINILAVDKVKNTITFDPLFYAIAPTDINTTTDVFTLPDTTAFPTGTPIKIESTGIVPAPLAANTIYYAINTGTTTLKLATTYGNAMIGSAIDMTSQGSGSIRFKLSYVFGDNDEIWLDGRKGKLTMLWNVDYPTPETSEYLAIKPGTDSSNTVSAIAKSSNRLFIFTKNSGTRWDGQNLVVFNNSVGCISHRSIRNIDDDWLIWVDAKGNVRARNETAGQQENISRPVRNRYLRKLTLDQLKAVSGGLSDNTYKLYLGQIGGENIRLCYDFDANTWSPERLGKQALISSTADFSGTLKPYFFAENGKMYMDETGNLDDDQTIPMEAGTGRDMFGTEQLKRFTGMLIYSRGANGMKVEAAVDGGQMKTIARIKGAVCYVPFPQNGESKLDNGTSFDWQIVGAIEGDPPYVEGATVYYSVEEDTPSERRR